MNPEARLAFDSPDALASVAALGDDGLDRLDFGVIGFDRSGVIQQYNARETRFSGLPALHVIGRELFTDVAQCMNNDTVARRFEAAEHAGAALDAVLSYTLIWRMRPRRAQLRLLGSPQHALRYLFLRHDLTEGA